MTSPTKTADRKVPDPPLARRAASTACVAFALAALGFAIPYPDGGTVAGLHGLAILAVPIALLLAVVSRANAKELAAFEQTEDPDEERAKWLAKRARPVLVVILAVALLVGTGTPRLVGAVAGVCVLVAWLAWLERTEGE